MKIIHTGDIHLDSPFTTSNPVDAEKRRNALRSAFSSLILYAKTQKTDIFLICGDLFDDDCVTKDTCLAICKEMASVPECSFFITPGNHDPYIDSSPYMLVSFPENVHIFTEEKLSFYEIPGKNVRIYGSAYREKTKGKCDLSPILPLDESKVNILMHHGDIDVPLSQYCSISREDIERGGFDYVAMGHIHKGSEILSVGKTKYAYCGCIEGRDFGECGYKGAIVGDIEKGNINLSHVRFCAKRYEEVFFDVTGYDDFTHCLQGICEKCASFGEDTLLRVTLSGLVSEHFTPSADILRTHITKPCYIEIKDKTLALLNGKNLKSDKTLAGEFYRALEEKLESEDENTRENASLALKYGLRAIYGLDLNI